jgi:hypothetical protein
MRAWIIVFNLLNGPSAPSSAESELTSLEAVSFERDP